MFPAVVKTKRKITLNEKGDSYENDWRKGDWTMVYNQGFEVFVNFRSYFAFSKYTKAQVINQGNLILDTF